jgi:cell division protein FtsB
VSGQLCNVTGGFLLLQLELLHQQLEENEQKVQQLSQTVCQLADQQERLQQKLSDAKNK